MPSLAKDTFSFAEPLLYACVGVSVFVLRDAAVWGWPHAALFTLIIAAAMDVLTHIVMAYGALAGYDKPDRAIPVRGKHLDVLQPVDLVFIAVNKLLTALFVYHCAGYLWRAPTVVWSLHAASLTNTLGALLLFYVIYDLGYALFHRALHLRAVYAYIHKHHHRQKAPSRGNLDAINVHPFEFIVGEYNHLFTVWATGAVLSAVAERVATALPEFAASPAGRALVGAGGVHIGVVAFFILFGGVLASFNHTRFDIRCPVRGLEWVYQVNYHDVHHWFPPCNYGQYTMLWDYAMGTFKPHPADCSPDQLKAHWNSNARAAQAAADAAKTLKAQ